MSINLRIQCLSSSNKVPAPSRNWYSISWFRWEWWANALGPLLLWQTPLQNCHLSQIIKIIFLIIAAAQSCSNRLLPIWEKWSVWATYQRGLHCPRTKFVQSMVRLWWIVFWTSWLEGRRWIRWAFWCLWFFRMSKINALIAGHVLFVSNVEVSSFISLVVNSLMALTSGQIRTWEVFLLAVQHTGHLLSAVCDHDKYRSATVCPRVDIIIRWLGQQRPTVEQI